jgi:hypothetical protein
MTASGGQVFLLTPTHDSSRSHWMARAPEATKGRFGSSRVSATVLGQRCWSDRNPCDMSASRPTATVPASGVPHGTPFPAASVLRKRAVRTYFSFSAMLKCSLRWGASGLPSL